MAATASDESEEVGYGLPMTYFIVDQAEVMPSH
jgi:hypothetical protein